MWFLSPMLHCLFDYLFERREERKKKDKLYIKKSNLREIPSPSKVMKKRNNQMNYVHPSLLIASPVLE